MKKIILNCVFILFVSFIQAQQWNWASITAGGNSVDRNIIMAKGTSGDFYIAGDFEQTQSFGTFTLTPIGTQDVFVAKYDQAGTCLWAIQGGGVFSANETTGIETDNSGNVYIGGNFSNQIVLGGYTLNLGTNSSCSFIAKFDPSGNCLFANPIFSKGSTLLHDLKKDNLGDFIITGLVYDSTTFGSVAIASSPSANLEIYLAKFNSAGNFSWVKTAGGSNGDEGWAVSSDPAGNIYLGGVFKLTATFGTHNVTSYGDYDIFISKYDNSGNNIWVTHAGATGLDQLYGLSNDATGNTYATGFYYPTPAGMSTSPAHFGSFLLADNGAGNMFVAKLDSNGTFVWANKGGGTQYDEGHGISTDANGNSYVTGLFTATAIFGTTSLTSAGDYDVFINKYNKSGQLLFAQKLGGSARDKGKSVISYSTGESIFAGNFSSTITVNTTPPTSLTTATGNRVFLVKYSGGSVGVDDVLSEENSISLYPNPIQTELTVSLMNYKPGIYRFEIFDIYGKLIATFNNSIREGLNDFRFNTSSFDSGSYIIKITNDQKTYIKRFVVSK